MEAAWRAGWRHCARLRRSGGISCISACGLAKGRQMPRVLFAPGYPQHVPCCHSSAIAQHTPLLPYITLCQSASSIAVATALRQGACVTSRSLCVTAAQSHHCWSCHTVLNTSQLFCPSCKSLQPPDTSKDYFQILHCDRSFDVNIPELQKNYRDLQRSLHPDYFSQKSQYEQDLSDQQSSLVNKAYNTLLSPLRRGIYLLCLHGITFTEGTEGGTASPFLFEILEISERLNEANTDAEIEEIEHLVQANCQSLTENIQEAFRKDDFESAKMLLIKLKYYSNIANQVKKKIFP
ncbi:iron-sulfur cluster co-chaperone protein HscB [Hyperolius riggenbachi]|uniref:iron-sulfur cluster co-chaperone protein HscB n=1 Tax=Hyperolius riggenbachi TaxID=752182 RepID=UPI0035A319FC